MILAAASQGELARTEEENHVTEPHPQMRLVIGLLAPRSFTRERYLRLPVTRDSFRDTLHVWGSPVEVLVGFLTAGSLDSRSVLQYVALNKQQRLSVPPDEEPQ